jgi:hypothetical protein
MTGQSQYGEINTQQPDMIAFGYNVIGAFVRRFARTIDRNLEMRRQGGHAADMVIVMMGQQNAFEDELPFSQRIEHRRGFAWVYDNAFMQVIVQKPNVIIRKRGNTDKIHRSPLFIFSHGN